MRPTKLSSDSGRFFAYMLPAHTLAASTAAMVVAALFLVHGQPARGAPPRPRASQSGAVEVLPAPQPSAGASRDPLAQLLAGNEARGVGQLSVDIRPRDVREGKPAGEMPTNVGAAALARQIRLTGTCRRDWPSMCFHWEASAICHQPLYFEETNLERYGYSPRGLRLFQPVLSAGNFFLTVPLLPYKMAVQPPREGIYTLGQYRPGSPAPYRINRLPFSFKGVMAEAAVITGLILLIQ